MWRMKFGTPTFVIDEADFRHRIRRYRAALPDARLVYAGRELLTSTVARWVVEEGGGLGVCSRGELATALVAGVDPNQIVVRSTAATSGELCNAASVGVGRIIVENPIDVAFLSTGLRRPQSIQVRVSSDIDSYEQNSVTAYPRAAEAIDRALDQSLVCLVGLHCHLGSQVADGSLYGEAIRQM